MNTAEERANAGLQTDREKQTRREDELEDYAGGYIQSHHGSVPAWLLVVYTVLFMWALYYLYVYWGGLGPGLAD